ncbi:MAG: PDDEXK nuclease domain-containing protein [Sporocytophaga sp.]|nr:PDDEXK nuclease domain-containing protein [Sporocytophaga sp.]
MVPISFSDQDYLSWFTELKTRIKRAQISASLKVNQELIQLYWYLGENIVAKQEKSTWGDKFIEKLAIDLKMEYPKMKGFSKRNLQVIRQWYLFYNQYIVIAQQLVAQLQLSSEVQNVQQAVAQTDISSLLKFLSLIPWGHHQVILNKCSSPEEAFFYLVKTNQNNWSRSILEEQVKSNLFQRQGKALNNFTITLPKPQADLAKETLKNPYQFDFLTLGEEIRERELENALIQHLKKFMLELGRGFAYVGNQFNLNVSGDDYFLDLLFYNTHLHCYVVFELKMGEFKPEYAGKLNFYINTIDSQIKGKEDKPTIGVLLCKTPNDTVVQFSLQGIKTPIGVAEYELIQQLPEEIKTEMPSIEELEEELDKEVEKMQRPLDKKLEHVYKLINKINQPEIQQVQNKDNTKRVFTETILPLRSNLLHELKPLIEQFSNIETRVWVQGKGFQNDQEVFNEVDKYETPNDFRISIKLDGLKKAGTQSFYISTDLIIKMERYKYICYVKDVEEELMWQKLYHELPTREELNHTIEQFGINLAEQMIIQLERISN